MRFPLFRGKKREEELDAEIRSHLDEAIRDRIARGEAPDEARTNALREFGNVGLVKEVTREMWGWATLERLMQDLRFGVRMMLKQPGFTLIVVILLALGIGADTAFFSVVDAVLLKRLPVKDPEQLVLLGNTDENSDRFSYTCYERMHEQSQVTSGLLAYYPLRLTVEVSGQREPATMGQLVSENYFQVLGISAAAGRMIAPEDDGADSICVISHGYWQRRFGRDPAIIGKTIHLSGHPFTIIGVTPPEFFGLEVGSSMDISVPLNQQTPPRKLLDGRVNTGLFHLMGRLLPGVTMAQAQASLGLIYQQHNAVYAARISNDAKGLVIGQRMLQWRLRLASGSQGLSDLRRQFSQPLFVLLCVVALVLLITCANVAGLLLGRGVARRKELAVRLALGAGRWRLVRQLFTESLLLACLGGLLGLLLAWWGTQLLLPLLSQSEIPLSLNLQPDLRMLGFTAAVAVLTSVLFGLTPAFLATRVELQSALKQDAPGRSGRSALSFGRIFVIAQVALSLLLLVGAGLFVRSLQKLQQVETGYERENALVLKLEPVGSDRKSPRLIALYDELLRRVKAMPSVVQASLVGYSPISRREWLVEGDSPLPSPIRLHELYLSDLFVEGQSSQPAAQIPFNLTQVYPNSFAALGIPLVAGRDFGSQDTKGSQAVAIINESMARQFFGRENPVGRRFGTAFEGRECCYEIIGVVKDAKYISLREESRPMYYLPFAQADSRGQMTLVVRTAGTNALLAAAIQHEARALDPQMPHFEVETLAAQLDVSLTQERLIARLSSLFGLLALVLVCIGLYGVLAYDVARRTHEIGIRMALGASAGRVVRMVLNETLWLVSIGLVIGSGAALAATRWVKSLLFGLEPHDPLTIGLAVLTLLIVAAVAGYLPARRAAKVDPLIALRHE